MNQYRSRLLIYLATLVTLGTVEHSAWCRVEYALQEKLNCSACHATPWGGGPRTGYGKICGAHGNQASPLSGNDVYYADLRAQRYSPASPTTRVNGLAMMQAAVAGNVPILQGGRNSELRGVLSYDLTPLTGAYLREGYARWLLPSDSGKTPPFLTFGHFYVPFGLLTDEHRAYTRIQTDSSINAFDAGGALSINVTDDIHGDVAIVNDLTGSGQFTRGNVTWGGVLNARWNPVTFPFLVGSSANYQHTLQSAEPYAFSYYAGLSADRLTSDRVSGSLLVERVDAWNWNDPAVNPGIINPGPVSFFVPPANSAYANSIRRTHSVGYFSQIKYNLTHQWTPFYRIDYFNPDTSRDDNTFVRHGFGIEAYLVSNVIINVRYEKAVVAPQHISASDALGSQSDVFAMLRLWL